jgi:arylsulfatase A-like enzyme
MRDVVHWAALTLALTGCGGPSGSAGDEGAGPAPNLLIYLVDTLRRDHVGVYGYERDTTPRLDAFARDAVVFDDARTPTSWTRPATATLLTGLYPNRHGAITRTNKLDPRVTLLGTWLQQAGYHTAAFVTNPNVVRVWGFDQGFAHFQEMGSADMIVRSDRVTHLLLKHMEAAPATPFFYYAHTMDPHEPYDPAPPFDRTWPRTEEATLLPNQIKSASPAQLDDMIAAYDGEIAFNDHQFGLILDRLKAQGLYDDTLIIFTSDHGEEFLEHGYGGHGSTLFDDQLRIPLVIKFPRNAHAGTVVRQRVSLLDIAPTVLAEAGVTRPDGLEGTDLVELLSGAEQPQRPLFLDLDLVNHGKTNFIQGVMLGSYKYLRAHAPVRVSRLFDLGEDPGEKSNLFADMPRLAQELGNMVDGHMSQAAGGIHLWLVNDPSSNERVFEGTLRTTGRFVQFRTLQLEKGDTAALTDNDTVVTFRCALRNRPHPQWQVPRFLVDDDRITFRVEPRDAEVTVERFLIDGEPGSLYLGRWKQRTTIPASVSQDMAELRVPDMGLLFEKGMWQSITADAGAYLGVVPPPRREDVEIDPELRRQLEALGYLE